MTLSGIGFSLIEHLEGVNLKAYVSPAGVWTIGYGHTTDVLAGNEITEEEAKRLLRIDVSEAESVVNGYVMAPISQCQFDALSSFVFNVGSSNFRKSTLLKRLNYREYSLAAEEFLRWIHLNGKIHPGLVLRRLAEKKMFLGVDS